MKFHQKIMLFTAISMCMPLVGVALTCPTQKQVQEGWISTYNSGDPYVEYPGFNAPFYFSILKPIRNESAIGSFYGVIIPTEKGSQIEVSCVYNRTDDADRMLFIQSKDSGPFKGTIGLWFPEAKSSCLAENSNVSSCKFERED